MVKSARVPINTGREDALLAFGRFVVLRIYILNHLLHTRAGRRREVKDIGRNLITGEIVFHV